jgi:hypothetical protein
MTLLLSLGYVLSDAALAGLVILVVRSWSS